MHRATMLRAVPALLLMALLAAILVQAAPTARAGSSAPAKAVSQYEYPLITGPDKAAAADGSGELGDLAPADIESAYNIPPGGGQGATVGIVVADHDPTLESDLAAYRAQYNLPACTLASGCLRVVNENGGSDLPTATENSGYLEESLDVDMVSAACPLCHILVVEASDQPAMSDWDAAEDIAVKLGSTTVSNSFLLGGPPLRSSRTSPPSRTQACRSSRAAVTMACGRR